MLNFKDLLANFLPKAMEFFQKKAEESVKQPVKPVVVELDLPLDWNNPKSRISSRFSVHEATWLPSWKVYHKPTDDQKKAIVKLAEDVGQAADILEKKLGRKVSIMVHAWMRPDVSICPGSQWDGKDYNRYIYETQVWKDMTPEQKAAKSVPKSPHRNGFAVDFHIAGFETAEGCAKIRELLVPHLEELKMRMEDVQGAWIHLDNLPVIRSRFFKP